MHVPGVSAFDKHAHQTVILINDVGTHTQIFGCEEGGEKKLGK